MNKVMPSRQPGNKDITVGRGKADGELGGDITKPIVRHRLEIYLMAFLENRAYKGRKSNK